MFMPLRLATDARNIDFVTDLDLRIDDVGLRADEAFTGMN
jgi:hypothetical protein